MRTPFGLRTLAADDPNYHPHYVGDQARRDPAYHQGTVWPFLLGPFLTAWVRLHGGTAEVRREALGFLRALEQTIDGDGCFGHLPEVFDADPPHAGRGCFAQAWSAGALLAALDESILDRPWRRVGERERASRTAVAAPVFRRIPMTLSAAATSSEEASFGLVVGLKLDDGGAFAVEEAVRVAQRIPRCSLHLVHVMAGASSAVDTSELVGHLRLYANEKVKSLGGAHQMTIGIHVRAGEVSAVLSDFAREVGADLLIVGSDKHHRPSWYRAPLVERLLETTSCPVVVAGPKPRPHLAANDATATIEPPCPACVQARAASHGATWWCSQHEGHMHRPHGFSYQRELPLRTPDTLVFPSGMG